MPNGNDWRSLFLADGRLRSGWRILLFTALFLSLTVVGGGLLRLAGTVVGWSPPPPQSAAGLFVSSSVTLAAAVIAGAVLLAWVDDRRPAALGFGWTSRTPWELIAGLAIGAGSLVVVIGAIAVAGWVAYRPEPGGLGTYTVVVLQHLVLLSAPAAAEEALFRGYPFQALVEGIGPALATLLFSGAFALAHAYNPDVGAFAFANIFLAGVLLSVAYLRTRSLWFVTALHLAWNWSMASVLDLPVSGIEFFDTPLYEPIVRGPAWVTGGTFGPEAGVAASVSILIAIALVARLRGLGEAPEMRAHRPLVDGRLGAAE